MSVKVENRGMGVGLNFEGNGGPGQRAIGVGFGAALICWKLRTKVRGGIVKFALSQRGQFWVTVQELAAPKARLSPSISYKSFNKVIILARKEGDTELL